MATTNESIPATAQEQKEQPPLRLLVIEDSAEDFNLCMESLRKAQLGVRAVQAASRSQFAFLLDSAEYDVIVSDYSLGGWNGLDAFEILRESEKSIPFILVSGALGEERAVDCIKRGMADFILKTRLSALPGAILRAVEGQRIRNASVAAETALRDSERRFRVLADSIGSAVLVYRGTQCLYANTAARLLTGYGDEELFALSSWDLFHPDSRALLIQHGFSHLTQTSLKSRYELKLITKEGETRTCDASVGITEIDGQPAGIITAVDITERNSKEAARRGTVRDPLTGLFNTAQMQSMIRAEVKRSERSGRSFALLALRLRETPDVAEELLSLTESRALCKLANLVGGVCRSSDTAFRYEAREFAVLLPETAAAGARQLSARLGERITAESKDCPLAIDAGIAVFPQDGPSLDHLLKAARRNLKKLQPRPRQFAKSA